MHAILRLNSFDEVKFASASDDLRNFDELHAAQPGFVGTMTVDLGGGRRITLNRWRSPQDAKAALAVLKPGVKRVLEPLMSSPSQLIGAGAVVSSDFIPGKSARICRDELELRLPEVPPSLPRAPPTQEMAGIGPELLQTRTSSPARSPGSS